MSPMTVRRRWYSSRGLMRTVPPNDHIRASAQAPSPVSSSLPLNRRWTQCRSRAQQNSGGAAQPCGQAGRAKGGAPITLNVRSQWRVLWHSRNLKQHADESGWATLCESRNTLARCGRIVTFVEYSGKLPGRFSQSLAGTQLDWPGFHCAEAKCCQLRRSYWLLFVVAAFGKVPMDTTTSNTSINRDPLTRAGYLGR